MSKQKRGMFSRMMATMAMAIGMSVTHRYDDPSFYTPENRRRKKRGTGSGMGRQLKIGQKRRWHTMPRCKPGTITYHDKLVRHFGRRLGTGARAWRAGCAA